MNYSKKHIKHIAYKDYLINKSGKYSFKGFKMWYAQTAFDVAEAAHIGICYCINCGTCDSCDEEIKAWCEKNLSVSDSPCSWNFFKT